MRRVSVSPHERCKLQVAKVKPSMKNLVKAVSKGNVNLDPKPIYGESYIEINNNLLNQFVAGQDPEDRPSSFLKVRIKNYLSNYIDPTKVISYEEDQPVGKFKPLINIRLSTSNIIIDVSEDHPDRLEKYLRMLAITQVINRPCIFLSFKLKVGWYHGKLLNSEEQIKLLGDVITFIISKQDAEYLYNACDTFTTYMYYRDYSIKNMFHVRT